MTIKRLLVGALLAASACSDPRQIVLSIDTSVGIPCDIDRVRVRATGVETSTYEQDLTGEPLPISLKLNDSTSNGSFMLEVSGLKGTTEVLRVSGPLTFGNGIELGLNVVLDESCGPDAGCPLPEAPPYTGPPAPVAARFTCGQSISRYAVMPATETFTDVCNTPPPNAGKVLDAVGSAGALKLPLMDAALANFRFQFYGRPVRQVWAHEDGYIAFTMNNPDPLNDLDAGALDRDLRNDGVPPPLQSALIFWDTLTLSSTGVCYSLEGTPGTQKLRITWKGTCDISPCGSDNLNFTIVLDERTSRISFTYGDMLSPSSASRGLGANATVGVVNRADGCPAAQCTDGLCMDGRPCGYTQSFSNTQQMGRVPNIQFIPMP